MNMKKIDNPNPNFHFFPLIHFLELENRKNIIKLVRLITLDFVRGLQYFFNCGIGFKKGLTSRDCVFVLLKVL